MGNRGAGFPLADLATHGRRARYGHREDSLAGVAHGPFGLTSAMVSIMSDHNILGTDPFFG
jgi:hypothetical protein